MEEKRSRTCKILFLKGIAGQEIRERSEGENVIRNYGVILTVDKKHIKIETRSSLKKEELTSDRMERKKIR